MPNARILLLGLAPAAHGGNRTGRVFTGDASGDFLWARLHAAGLADRPVSRRADDGLTLHDVYIAAAVRCAPPANKPTIEERDTCAPFLVREVALLGQLRVVVALGAFGWDAALRTFAAMGHEVRPKPRFGHAAEVVAGPYTLIGSYHPSQQNVLHGPIDGADVRAVLERASRLSRRQRTTATTIARSRSMASGLPAVVEASSPVQRQLVAAAAVVLGTVGFPVVCSDQRRIDCQDARGACRSTAEPRASAG